MKKFIEQNFKYKTVLVRVDFNVPLNEKLEITDDSRIISCIPTIKKLLKDKARVIIMSHLGRPKGIEEKFSLKRIIPHLEKILKKNIYFSDNCIGEKSKKMALELNYGEVLLLENLRFHIEEKNGDIMFAKQLSELADIYVNDAFGTSHRNHASTSVITQFFANNKYVGLLMKSEIDNLTKALDNPKRPFTAIIGGSKVSSKIDVIISLLDKVDNLIIGGGMAYTFSKSMGGNIGDSLVEDDKISSAKEIMILAKNKGVNVFLPTDSINADSFNNKSNISKTKINDIPNGFMGLDIGEDSIVIFSEIIEKSKTIIWNGPMGVFEMTNFQNGTVKIGNAICRSTKKGAFSLVGGGDSVAAIKKFSMVRDISYISTGGGAMLEYLEGKDLPGIKAIYY